MERSFSVGFDTMMMNITGISDDNLFALGTTQNGLQVKIPLANLPTKSPYPQVGERWLISKKGTGYWRFIQIINAPPPPTITGTRDANSALASLLSELSTAGLVVDDTTEGSSGGGGYASLTGPGQSSSPGGLTQQGNFEALNGSSYGLETSLGDGVSVTVIDPVVALFTESGKGITIYQSDAGGSIPSANGGILIRNVSGVLGSTNGITIEDQTGRGISLVSQGGGGITLNTISGGPGFVQIDTGALGFFGATPISQPSAITAPTGGSTVDTQARTAIVAILNLLSAAASGYGLTA